MDDGFRWCWGEGDDPERFFGPYLSRSEAEQVARETMEGAMGWLTLLEGRLEKLIDDIFSAELLFDDFADRNADYLDPDVDRSGLEEATDRQRRELEEALAETLRNWRERHGLGYVWAFAETRNRQVIAFPQVRGEPINGGD